MRTWTLALTLVWLIGGEAVAADWDTQAFRDEPTLEFMTVSSDGEEHWTTVWLVVIDGDVYVNLGKRAAERVRANTRAPFVSVRVAGTEFGRIRADPAQELQPAVAAAIAAKYWTGFLVPYTAPSQVMRLRPENRAVSCPRLHDPAGHRRAHSRLRATAHDAIGLAPSSLMVAVSRIGS